MRNNIVFRARLILAVFIVIACVLVVRLYFVQVVDGAVYEQEGMQQYMAAEAPIDDRGDIIFTTRGGEPKTAATTDSGFRVVVEGGAVPEPASDAYEQIAAILPDIDRAEFIAHAENSDGRHRDIARRVSSEDADAIRQLRIPGIALGVDRWRVYPYENRAAHAVGFVGYSGVGRAGQYGIERYWENTLAHENDGLYVNFFAEIFSNVRAAVSDEERDRDGDIITSIEPTVQQHLERQLIDVRERYSAPQAGGVVMDPATGRIVAMTASPDFDPNAYNTLPDSTAFSNPLIENIYELGSIVKPLTVASGLDADEISPSTTYTDEGSLERSGFTIHNYDGRGRGVVDMQEVLSQSLNTGAVFIKDRLGTSQFTSYMQAFGLAERSGIDLPNEARGWTDALKTGASEIDYASASFGQGFAVTPIVMTRALAALANGGELVTPHVTTDIRYRSGVRTATWQPEPERVISEETSEEITRMLVEVVDDALLGGGEGLEHYSIAAKTGTAQIGRADGAGYYEDRYLHSFFGYFPAYDPEFIVFLYVREPQGVSYASETLARPFLDFAEYLINYYDIPPDR